MSDMTDVLKLHHIGPLIDGGWYCFKCDHTTHSFDEAVKHQAAALSAAGFGPVREARAGALSEFAAESQERSDTFMKTMQHMADSREYSADDVLRYGAYAAEANTTAYRLRARAAAERGGDV